MKTMEYLSRKQVPFEVIRHSEACDAQRLASALHVSGDHVAKTVLLKADGGYTWIVAVLPASKRVELELLSKAFGYCRLELAHEDDISEHCPETERGVLPPFGKEYCMKTVVDESLTDKHFIYFEGDSHSEAIRMKFEDFCRIEQPLKLPFAV
jgi:Ala-tRNA(Pro) deacylase